MISEQPLVSVIIPCYNVGAFVEQAIRSILDQTYVNMEILVVDDASTDNTLEKILLFKDERIRLFKFNINTEKIGAVNAVLGMVNGDFITFQDADDWSEPDRIKQQVVQFCRQPRLGICFTKYRYAGFKTGVPGRIAITNDELRDEFLEFGNKTNSSFDATNCPTMMITREVLQQTRGYNPYFKGRVAEDIQWIYRILTNYEGVTVDVVLYNYRVREGSFTETAFAGQNAKYAYSWQLLSKIIYKDVHENIDVLDAQNKEQLAGLELAACEEKLLDTIKLLHSTRNVYERSFSFRLGKFILTPVRLIKSYRKRK